MRTSSQAGDPFDPILYAEARHGGFRLLRIDRIPAAFGAVLITPK
jgi:PIN domain nuclease of toxin-antitoxin system